MRNIAIVGIGNWGKNLVREFNKKTCVKYCVSKGNRDNINWLHDNYPGIASKTNLKEILADASIDAVVVATPINTHFEIAKRVLESGKHVFIEKPITENLEQAEEIIRIAKNKGLVLFVGYIFLHSPIFKTLRSKAKGKSVSQLYLSWEKFGSFREKIELNLATHDFSLAHALIGMPNDINILSRDKNLLVVSLEHENTNCTIYINRISPEKSKRLFLQTENESYHWINNKLYISTPAKFKEIKVSQKSPLEVEINYFLSLLDKSSDKLDYEFALNQMRMLSFMS